MDFASWQTHRLRRTADVLAALVLLAGGAAIGWLGRYWSFFYDEWGTIAYRRSGGAGAFLAPHNGHLIAVEVSFYRVMFATVGLRSYHPYLGVLIAAHLLLVGLLYLYARSRVGPLAGLLAVVPVLFLGYAWQVLLWAFDIGWVLTLVGLVAILLWPRPAVMALGLALALATSGPGVAVAAGALVLVVVSERRRRLLVAWALPVAGYLLWWFAYRPSALTPASLRSVPGATRTGDVGSISFPLSNLRHLPGYVARSAASAAGALASTGPGWGWWVLTGLAAVAVATLARRRRVSPRLVAIALTGAVFWVETAMTRAQLGSPASPAASRYLYPGAVLIVLFLVEAADGIRIPWPAVVVGTVLVGLVAWAGVDTVRQYGGYARGAFAQEAAMLRRAQCGPPLPPTTALDPQQAPLLTAGVYRAAVRDLGSPPGQSCRP